MSRSNKALSYLSSDGSVKQAYSPDNPPPSVKLRFTNTPNGTGYYVDNDDGGIKQLYGNTTINCRNGVFYYRPYNFGDVSDSPHLNPAQSVAGIMINAGEFNTNKPTGVESMSYMSSTSADAGFARMICVIFAATNEVINITFSS